MLNFDLADLSHLVQDSHLTLETRMALILLHHGLSIDELYSQSTLPNYDWVAFEKPFVKIFKKSHPAAPFATITERQLLANLAPFIKKSL
ncbi:hypothetical protein [Periweissella fabalis]|uniref:Uncharacterized protein n=1 Tax=Periweissella fabalis TaxID=1070421 RepID=A0A7X6MZW0_9LACO|nr:hypothetical protein [Periweissella fabalis]MCM0598953.1 hypothetical protein [Periweissella fabalis]NKZ23233.1 hypothetical protein [Periweissella fabalis]